MGVSQASPQQRKCYWQGVFLSGIFDWKRFPLKGKKEKSISINKINNTFFLIENTVYTS